MLCICLAEIHGKLASGSGEEETWHFWQHLLMPQDDNSAIIQSQAFINFVVKRIFNCSATVLTVWVSNPSGGKTLFSFQKLTGRLCGPRQTPIRCVPAFFPGGKATGA